MAKIKTQVLKFFVHIIGLRLQLKIFNKYKDIPRKKLFENLNVFSQPELQGKRDTE